MKVLLINGSPKKEGNTYLSLNLVMEELVTQGIDCELIWIGAENLRGCLGCGKCKENKDRKCSQTHDKMNEYIAKIIEADGIVLGSPTYFADLTTNTKALIERAGYVCRANGGLLKRKIGASVVAMRRAGGAHVFSSINFFFLIAEMIVVGSSYWNLGVAAAPGEVLNDAEGVETFKTLGKNIAFVLQKINS